MAFTLGQVREMVIQALAKCLGRHPDEIKGSAALIQDLGLDSLEFLDLMFALEKSFAVKIRDADFDRLLKPAQNESLPPHLSEEEIKAMSRFIPDLDTKSKEGPIPRNSIISLMTTEALVNMIAFKLKAQ